MIKRSQDGDGAWTYAVSEEHEFVVWVDVGCTTSHSHDFGSGRQVPWRHSLLSMDGFINSDERTGEERDELMHTRGLAFEAYKAGNYALQDAKLGMLQETCRRMGMLPLARVGENVSNAYMKRDDPADKADFTRLVRTVAAPLPRTLKAWLELPVLAPYANKYKGRDTLRGWIKEALPGALKTGRPRKGTVIR